MRSRDAGAIDRAIDAEAAGQGSDLSQGVLVTRIDDRSCAQFHGPLCTPDIALHADDARAAIACVDHRAEADRPQPGHEHGIEGVGLQPLEGAKAGAQAAAGQAGMIVRDAVRNRNQQPVRLEQILSHRRLA